MMAMTTRFRLKRTNSTIGTVFYLTALHPPTWSTTREDALTWPTETEAMAAAPTVPYGAVIVPEVVLSAPMSPTMDAARCEKLREVGRAMLEGYVELSGAVLEHARKVGDQALEQIVEAQTDRVGAVLSFLQFDSEGATVKR